MSSENGPIVRTLQREESEAILARNNIGRMAYARNRRIDIEPIHYVYSDGWIYGRTSPGRKLEMTGEDWWPVAFEVDEVEEVFQWRSVVVHGGFYVIETNGADTEREAGRRAVHLLRSLIPETLRDDDPVPHRRVLFRIAVQEISGREAVPREIESASASA